MKIRPVETELLHVDRQTDLMKLKVAVCHFAKAPKNVPRNTTKYVSWNDGNVQPNVLFPFS